MQVNRRNKQNIERVIGLLDYVRVVPLIFQG